MKWLGAVSVTLIATITLGCASKPPTQEAAYAISGYTSAVEIATTTVEQTLKPGDISEGTYEAVLASIEGSRLLRDSLYTLIQECELYLAKHKDKTECPTSTQIRAITTSLIANTDGLTTIIDAATKDR